MRTITLLLATTVFLGACANRAPMVVMPVTSYSILAVDTPEQFRRAPMPSAAPEANATAEPGAMPAGTAVPAVPYVTPNIVTIGGYPYIPYPYVYFPGPRVAFHGRGGLPLTHGRHGRHSGGSTVGAVGIGLAVGLIAFAVENNRANNRLQADSLMDRVALDPALSLTEALNKRMMRLPVPVTPINDLPLTARARAEYDFSVLKTVAAPTSTIVDIRVDEFAFDYSVAYGFRPMMGVTVTLYDAQKGEYRQQLSYWADHKAVSNDPRRFTFPPSMSYPHAEALASAEPVARAGFLAVIERVADQIVLDLAGLTAPAPAPATAPTK